MNPIILLAAAFLAPEADPDVMLPQLDHAELFQADLKRMEDNEPPHYSVPHAVADLWVEDGFFAGGQWSTAKDGTRIWRAKIVARGATTIDLGLSDVWLPQGAALTFSDASGSVVRGPFTDVDNRDHGELWTPMVPGEEGILELRVAPERAADVRLNVMRVNYGYRFNNDSSTAKALSCNVDVVCPSGDPYRSIIRSAAMYTNGSGNGICSGALVNTTENDVRPYFLTAEHCMGSNPASYVFYFNYQSDTCRTGTDSGQVLPRSIGDAVTGSSLLASSLVSDFALLELSAPVPDFIQPYFSGWDRRGLAPSMGVNVHHPATHEKRLTIENDPIISGSATVNLGRPNFSPDTYWEVLEWDEGVTEGGSSGSPLYNEDQHIVGQLGGGARFFCPTADEGSDYFGKLSVAWDTESSPQSRLADWLDPNGTGATIVDGSDGCDAPTVTATSSVADAVTGQTVSFAGSVSGGQAPYTFSWDVDGDGNPDSSELSTQARYASLPGRDGRITAALTVTDATGCPAVDRVAVRVRAPVIDLASNAPIEVCGDGDADLERGEIWEFPVSLTNTGDQAAVDALAGFRVLPGEDSAKRTGGPDGFGYTFGDSDEGFCAFVDVDLTGSPAENLPSDDDDAVIINFSGAPFNFYSQSIDSVSFTTNGYLSTDLADAGGDFSNDCPLPELPSTGGGARIMPLHDDLVVGGGLYHESFATCPRPADVGDPSQACEAFEWNGMRYFNTNTDFDVQAFLYPATGNIAFQYLGPDVSSADASVGIMNASFTRALVYACNENDAVRPGQAVCIYSPDGATPARSGAVRLLTPTITYGAIGVGETVTGSVQVLIEEDFPCGGSFQVAYVGTGHATGFAAPAGALLTGLVASGNCDGGAAACQLPAVPDFLPAEGFYFNADRPGNGIEIHFSGTSLYGAWYTAEVDQRPTWYYVQTLSNQQVQTGQISAELLSFEGPIEGPPSFEIAGEATFSFVDPKNGLLTWTLDGEPGGERITFFDLGDSTGAVTGITDQWFDATEAGWGMGVQQQNDLEFTAVYFYATDDLPAWVVSLAPDSLFAGSSPVAVAEVHCPGCVWTTPRLYEAGNLQRSYGSEASGTLTIGVDTDVPLGIRWQRNNINIESISGGR